MLSIVQFALWLYNHAIRGVHIHGGHVIRSKLWESEIIDSEINQSQLSGVIIYGSQIVNSVIRSCGKSVFFAVAIKNSKLKDIHIPHHKHTLKLDEIHWWVDIP